MFSHLIEVFNSFPHKLLICDIQVKEEKLTLGELCITSNKWMQLEQWLEFEHRLQLFIESQNDFKNNHFEETTFYLSSAVRIILKHSTKDSNSFKDFIEKTSYADRDIFVLDIFIERINIEDFLMKKQNSLKDIPKNEESEYCPKTRRPKKGEIINGQYIPYKSTTNPIENNIDKIIHDIENESTNNEYFPTTKKSKKCDIINGEYVPYKASKNTENTTISEINEPYSPKPVNDISDSSPSNIDDSPTTSYIPTYKPSRIRRCKKSIYLQSEENISLSDEKQKTQSENISLFGSDNETNNKEKNLHTKYLENTQTPSLKSKKISHISSKTTDTKSKHKKNINMSIDSLCLSKKKSIHGWLSKKNENKNENDIKKKKTNKEKKSHAIKIFEEEEIIRNTKENERQLEELKQLRVDIQKLKKPTPEKVEMLNLNHLSVEKILSTFEKFQNILDDVFEKNHKKEKISGFNGVDHIKTITLLNDQKKLKMMSFLRDHYQPNEQGVPTLTKLYTNAMLPEWMICVFMDEYQFTRDQALKRLNAQEDYAIYLERDLDLSRDF